MVRIISHLIVAGSLLLSSCHSAKKTSSQSVSAAKNKNHEQNTASKNIPVPYEAPRKKELRKKYGALLHVPSKKIKNYRLYYFVDEWYGVRYKYGGNTKTGVDCSSLVQQLYSHVYEREVPRTSSMQYDDSRKLRKKKKLKEGDLVFFTLREIKYRMLESTYAMIIFTHQMQVWLLAISMKNIGRIVSKLEEE